MGKATFALFSNSIKDFWNICFYWTKYFWGHFEDFKSTFLQVVGDNRGSPSIPNRAAPDGTEVHKRTTSRDPSEPEEDALGVQDWATTIYKCLGITADKELMAPGARPIEIVDGGKAREGLLA